jgi:hypothetical protein
MDSIYTYTVPTFTKLLGGLRTILDKGEAFAREKNIKPTDLLNERLAPDMFPLVRQVQIACDNAKGGVARLAGIENPKHEDTETTFDELRARIDKTLEFIGSVPEDAFKDAAERKITLSYFPDSYMTGFDYAREYVIPNFTFHIVTAYGILRHQGVPLGKADFINGFPLKKL